MMETEKHARQVVDEIFQLYERYGEDEYGERVNMMMHMMQAALLAEAEGCNDEMIIAAFLHDVGHFIEHAEKMGVYGVKSHDELGGRYLIQKGFPWKMANLVSSHVDAKRYLTATDSNYYSSLSEASRQTLSYQGGPMTTEEIALFEADEFHKDYVRLRQWDDQGKDPDQVVREEDLLRIKEKVYRYLVDHLAHHPAY